MGFCIGGTACSRLKCKQRCTGWFGAQPDLERACKNACKTDFSLTKDEFLCSGNWIDQQIVFGAYGYDPCGNDAVEISDYLDPLEDREYEAARMESLQNIFILLGLAVLAGLGILFIVKK